MISIITVVRNDAQGLRQTLESVATQDYPAIESIVIDGASTDGTLDVMKSYSSMLTVSRSEPDRGIYHAMNKGIEHANGALTLFLNAADTLSSRDTLRHFVDRWYQHGLTTKPNLYLCSVKTTRGALKRPRHLWIKQYYMMPSYHQGMLYPTSVLSEFRFSEKYKIASDVHHFLRIRPSVRLVGCNLTLATYDTTGISSTNIDERDQEFQLIYRELGIAHIFRVLKRLHELHYRLKK